MRTAPGLIEAPGNRGRAFLLVAALVCAAPILGLCGCAYQVEPLVRGASDLFPASQTIQEPGRILVYYTVPIEQQVATHTGMFPLTAPHQHFHTGRVFDNLLMSCLSANFRKVRRTPDPQGSPGNYDYLIIIDSFTSDVTGTVTWGALVYLTCEVRGPGGKTIAKRPIEATASAATLAENDTVLWAMERAVGEATEKAVVDCVNFAVGTVKAERDKR